MSPRAPKLQPVPDEAPSPRTKRSHPQASPEAIDRIRLTADRILVRIPDDSERRSKGGLLIPATAATPAKRCIWSDVVLVGPETRGVRVGDHVLFIPQSGLEVDVDGDAPHAGQYL